MLIAIVIAKKIFDTKIHRIHRIPNDFMSKWNSTIWAIWLGDWGQMGGKLNLWDMGFNLGHRGQLDFQVWGATVPTVPIVPTKQLPQASWWWGENTLSHLLLIRTFQRMIFQSIDPFEGLIVVCGSHQVFHQRRSRWTVWYVGLLLPPSS